jgi:hypothetical protein
VAKSAKLEHRELDLKGIEPVPAILLIPEKLQKPAPGLLYIHAHGGTYELGKEELLKGRNVLPAYAHVVAEKGYSHSRSIAGASPVASEILMAETASGMHSRR